MTDTDSTERDEAGLDPLSSILKAVTDLRVQVDDLVETVHRHAARLRTDSGVQVIEHRTAAEFEKVPEIGRWLAQQLEAAQPIRSESDLYGIDRIGWKRAHSVWSHFCG